VTVAALEHERVVVRAAREPVVAAIALQDVVPCPAIDVVDRPARWKADPND
jgi:hypothetical protein